VLLVLVGAQVAAVAVPAVYGNAQSDDNNLVQYAQPGGDPRAELQTIGAVASEGGNGTDVLLYYGEQGESYDDNLAYVKDDPNDWDSSSLTPGRCVRGGTTPRSVVLRQRRRRRGLYARARSTGIPYPVEPTTGDHHPGRGLDGADRRARVVLHQDDLRDARLRQDTTFWIHNDVQTESE